jgi:hypothetical protein
VAGDLDGLSAAALNILLDIPDWEGIRRELDRRKAQGPR